MKVAPGMPNGEPNSTARATGAVITVPAHAEAASHGNQLQAALSWPSLAARQWSGIDGYTCALPTSGGVSARVTYERDDDS
jgi:hypothetical protein